MIVAENISMKYRQVLKEIVALKEISLEVKKGEVFGLIGPDGAGKSTLFRVLTTLLLPTGGRASVGGFDVIDQYREVRNIVGYMPGKFSLYQDLSVEENLRFFASVF
ncbi:ATP-binding cassette domain-containing protein, partial [Butyricimonas muris]